MTLAELIEDLQVVGLNQTLFTGKPNATQPKAIDESWYPQIINVVNRGVRDIHMKFPINEKEVAVAQDEALAFYKLTTEFAETNTESTQPIKYIKDSQWNPFLGDIGMITSVHDEDNKKIPINDNSRRDSIFLKSIDTLMVPYPDSSITMFVLYRPAPQSIPTNTTKEQAQTLKIDLPDYAREALGTFVIGSLLSASIDSAKQQLASKYMASYGTQCQELLNQGVFPTYDDTTELGLYNRGWE